MGSSTDVEIVQRQLSAEAVRAAWTAYARTGQVDAFQEGSMFTAKARGGGVVVLAENRGASFFYVELLFECQPATGYWYSRGAAITKEWLAPGYGQILQVMLPASESHVKVGWRSEHKFKMSGSDPNTKNELWNDPALNTSHCCTLHTAF